MNNDPIRCALAAQLSSDQLVRIECARIAAEALIGHDYAVNNIVSLAQAIEAFVQNQNGDSSKALAPASDDEQFFGGPAAGNSRSTDFFPSARVASALAARTEDRMRHISQSLEQLHQEQSESDVALADPHNSSRPA